MSRFLAPDLSRLPDLPLVKPDFEKILQERLNDFKARAKAEGMDYNVEGIEADPIVIDQRVGADREVEVRSDHNDKVKAVLLATAWGDYLDHIGVTYYGVGRLELGTDPETKETILEKDNDYRSRIALAPEAFSTAGPEGAYIFHTLELDGKRDVVDAVCYSEEDGALYSDGLHSDAYSRSERKVPFSNRNDGDPVLSPEILIVILARVEYGALDQALLDRAYNAASRDEVRPLGDNVRIEPATITSYRVAGVLKFAPGADQATVLAHAREGVEAYVSARRRIGAIIQIHGLAAAMKVADVVELEITSPAKDIDPGSKGAAECSEILLRAIEGEATWRAIP